MLNHAPRVWYSTPNKTLISPGLMKSEYEPAVYFKHRMDLQILVGVYVDDLLIVKNGEEKIKEFKQKMMKMFDITDLGLLYTFLGSQVA